MELSQLLPPPSLPLEHFHLVLGEEEGRWEFPLI